MPDLPHLEALKLRLSHERARCGSEMTASQRDLRRVWIVQIESEIAGEMKFLGIDPAPACDLTDDELLAELSA